MDDQFNNNSGQGYPSQPSNTPAEPSMPTPIGQEMSSQGAVPDTTMQQSVPVQTAPSTPPMQENYQQPVPSMENNFGQELNTQPQDMNIDQNFEQGYGGQDMGYGEEEKPKSNKTIFVLIAILVLLLLAGGVVFAAWKEWIDIPAIKKLLPSNGSQNRQISPIDQEINPIDKIVDEDINQEDINEPPAISGDAIRKSDLAKIKTALIAYKAKSKSFPISNTVVKTNNEDSVLKALVTEKLLAILPVDPLSTYFYGYKSNGVTFELTCILEDKTDASGTTVGNYHIYKITDTSVETPATTAD